MLEAARLATAYETVRRDLLAARNAAGHWTGELSSSALSTATAVSALALFERHLPTTPEGRFLDEDQQRRLSELIVAGLRWLARSQNEDGGWGDSDKSVSNIATTMLVRASFQLTGLPADHGDLLDRADAYVEAQGGIAGLRRRYGKDKTFAVPILTNCALAGMVPWNEVSPLPFELACLPQSWFRFLRLPVVSYAIPALVAIGQARYFHLKPWSPVVRRVRAAAVNKSLEVLDRMQPASGGFLEATPLTSFVVMSLASIGQANHPVTRRGVEFLLRSVREDGAWPIDTNLATWVTTLSLNALASGTDGDQEMGGMKCLDWLLGCQHREPHPYTGAAPGGWGWSDLSGAVPDADDTPGALVALARWANSSESLDESTRCRITAAASQSVTWLLDLQNRDGGWPTFCRGWGALPFDRSGTDLTAHAIRALLAWQDGLNGTSVCQRIESALKRGFRYLRQTQRVDGSWLPLWFGNQHQPNDENPVYGTARVLLSYRDAGRMHSPPARKGISWLLGCQNSDGGWGGGPTTNRKCQREATCDEIKSSVEETAVAVEALLAAGWHSSRKDPLTSGVEWLVAAVETSGHREPSPIGFYFAKLWYYEKLYPLIFAVSALGQARNCLPLAAESQPASNRPTAEHQAPDWRNRTELRPQGMVQIGAMALKSKPIDIGPS